MACLGTHEALPWTLEDEFPQIITCHEIPFFLKVSQPFKIVRAILDRHLPDVNAEPSLSIVAPSLVSAF
jgi:hypothetical protein